MRKIYFTVAGTKHYFGNEFFEPGMKVQLMKEPDNEHDKEAIAVKAEGLGIVGYVANSPFTVKGESMSAGRIYDKIGDEIEGEILYKLPDAALGMFESEKCYCQKNRKYKIYYGMVSANKIIQWDDKKISLNDLFWKKAVLVNEEFSFFEFATNNLRDEMKIDEGCFAWRLGYDNFVELKEKLDADIEDFESMDENKEYVIMFIKNK